MKSFLIIMQPPGWEALTKIEDSVTILAEVTVFWNHLVKCIYLNIVMLKWICQSVFCVILLYCVVSVFDRILKVFLIKLIQIPLRVFPLFLAPPFLWSLVDTEGKKLQRSWTCPRSICLTYPSVYVAVVHWSQWTVWQTGGSVYVWPAEQSLFT